MNDEEDVRVDSTARPLIVTAPEGTGIVVDGIKLNTSEAALCRCGRSDALPFCDGSHRRES